uniref:Reverse transcriptase domain-containing protein n=1 Tax=Amphimedon queenslandica TaxID=400682 RepID=A0A1X7T2A1_AMPQE
MIRNRLVCGINSIRTQRILLQEPDLDYDKVFQIVQAMQLVAHDVSDIPGSKSQHQTLTPVHNLQHKKESSYRQSKVECYRYGGYHYATKCKFIEADCRLCGKKGHYAGYVAVKKRSHSSGRIILKPRLGKPIVVSVSANKVDLSMELDTGASISIMILTTHTGQKIKPVSAIDVDVRYQSQTATLPLVIDPGNRPTLLGLLQKHAPVLRSELEKLQDFTAKIHVQSDVKPKFYRPRLVALLLRQKIFNEIDCLRGLGVITPVKDYKVTVNPVLLTDTYPLPQSEDLFAALAGGKIFSKLDLKHAYLQIPLDEASKILTTINTPKGLFQYECLPFGVSSAPSLFQRTIENLLSHLHHVCVYIDDILVTGTDNADHLNNLHAVLQTLEEAGLTL